MNIIIFGAPGSGKGTMSKKLADELGIRHISSGDIIRLNQEGKTKIGLISDKIINDGGLLPDNIINQLIKQEIIDDKKSSGFIFDGFPRTSGQAKMLDQFMHKRGTPIDKVIFLEASKSVVMNRIIERGKESGRLDDTKEAFPKRWQAYLEETLPSVDYFEGRSKVYKINGDQDIETVYGEIKKLF